MKRLILTLSISIMNLLFSHNLFCQSKPYLITPEFLWQLGRVSDIKISPNKQKIIFGITRYDIQENKGNRDLYIVSTKGGSVKKITNTPTSEMNAIWRPDGQKIGYLSSQSGTMQIWEMNADGTQNEQISNVEGGVNGFSYSPDMKNIAYIKEVKLDLTIKEMHPDLPKSNAKIFTDLMYRHWDDWKDEYYSHIFIAPYSNLKNSNHIDIMLDEKFDSPLAPYGGMEQIAWSNDGSKLAYVSKKLTGKEYAASTNSDIFLYDLISKETKNISVSNLGYDMDPVFSPDGQKIVWQSMKTAGFESDKKRIIIYNLNNSNFQDYSKDFDQSASNFVWSKDSKFMYFISGINATYQIFSIEVEKKKFRQITEGTHDYTEIALLEKDIIGAKMSMSQPTEIFSVNIKSGKETQLTFTNEELLSKKQMGKVEKRWITTTDGKEMLVWLIFPPDFDSNKKYPAILYTQGGPQSAISQFFSYRWNFQLMAANGYIVIAPNRRGLPTFGQEWNDQISGDYGGQNQIDCLTAVDEICKEPYINADKLGAVGASYGGFSVYWLAGNHKKRFKAFIAHCGMFNFESWYGTTEEMFFANHDLGGAYYNDERPKSYDFSPHNFIKNWDTPLLVIHGGKDFRIPYTEGMQAFNAAQTKGIPSRFLFFPEENHFVLKPQNSILWQREFFMWLDNYLKS